MSFVTLLSHSHASLLQFNDGYLEAICNLEDEVIFLISKLPAGISCSSAKGNTHP